MARKKLKEQTDFEFSSRKMDAGCTKVSLVHQSLCHAKKVILLHRAILDLILLSLQKLEIFSLIISTLF